MWKRLLRDLVRAPDSSSCPEKASASKPAQEGFWFLWDVLSCLSGLGVLSCHVLFCVSSPGGLLIPPDFPREILGGSRRGSGCRAGPRGPRPKPPKTICHGLQSSLYRHGLQSSLHRHGLQSSLHRHGLQSSQLRHGHQSSQLRPWPPVVCSALEVPSCVPVRVCLRGLQSAHPPSPVETVTAWDMPSGRGELCQGSVMCVICSCLLCHIWFVSCPCFMSLWVNLCPAVCMWLCVNYPVYLVPVFWVWFGLVYSLLPGVSCLWVLPCPALMSLKTIIWV